MNKGLFFVLVIILLIGGFWFLDKSSDDVVFEEVITEEEMTEEETGNSNDDMPATTGDVKEFSVDGGDFYFSPAEMRVNQGDTVRITFNNVGAMPHDLVIDEFMGAQTAIIDRGEQQTIEFVANQSGTFEYYCSVGSHRQMGMVGQIIVE